MKDSLLKRVLVGVYNRTVYAFDALLELLGLGLFNRKNDRVVPKNASVYDPTVFGKYDLETQDIVPRAGARHASYNFDTMLQRAQQHRSSGSSPLGDDRIDIALGYVPPGDGIFLDACTPYVHERVRHSAAEAGYRYVAIDLNGDGETVLKEDLCRLSLESNSVALVFSVDTLEHIVDVDRAIGEIYRVLRPDGIAIVHVPAYFFARADSPEIDVRNDPHEHVRYFSGPDLVDRVFAGGLIPLRIGFNLDYGAAVVCAVKNPALWQGRTSAQQINPVP